MCHNNQIIHVSLSTYYQRRWNLECLARAGLITGYRISYCPVASDDPSAPCLSDDQLVIINAVPEAKEVWLEDLQPWTHYKVAIAMASKDQTNEPSEWSVARTRYFKLGGQIGEGGSLFWKAWCGFTIKV